MKRAIIIATLTLGALLGAHALSSAAGYPITEVILQARAWTFSALETFDRLRSGPNNARCTANLTPWLCCTGAGTGNCDWVTPAGTNVADPVLDVDCGPTSGDFCIMTLEGNVFHWLKADGTQATTSRAVWDPTQDRWESQFSSSIVAPTLETLDFNGVRRFFTAPVQTYAAGDPITFTERMSLETTGAIFPNGLVRPNSKVVEICPSGCEYATLNAACAGETSTAANPIEYRVGSGIYTGEIACSGEDKAWFHGEGATLQRDTTVALEGAFEPGTSSNYVFSDFRIKGKIYQDLNGTNGGTIVWRNLVIESSEVFGDNDCSILDRPGAVTRLLRENIDCATTTDGHTLHRDGANVEIYDKGNTYRALFASSAQNASMIMVRFNSTPCWYSDQGTAFNVVAAKTNSAMALTAYAWLGTDVTSCAGTARAFLGNITGLIRNTTSNQAGSFAQFVDVASAADELDELYVNGSTVLVEATDTNDTTVYGVSMNNPTTVPRLIASHVRAIGGLGNYDLRSDTTTPIQYLASDWLDHDPGRATPVATDQRDIVVTNTLTLRTTSDGPDMLIFDNTSEAANLSSPRMRFQNSTSAAGDEQFRIGVGSGGAFELYRDDDTFAFTIPRDFFNIANLTADLRINKSSPGLFIGDGSNTNNGRIVFDDDTADMPVVWDDSNNRIERQTASKHKFEPLATAPATCAIGDFYADTSGASCFCTSANTWTNAHAVGTCV